MGRDDKKRKKARKERAKTRQAQPVSKKSDGSRLRRTFSGKVRKGDALEVSFTFSGIPVPVDDVKDPSKGVVEKTAAQKTLWERMEPIKS